MRGGGGGVRWQVAAAAPEGAILNRRPSLHAYYHAPPSNASVECSCPPEGGQRRRWRSRVLETWPQILRRPPPRRRPFLPPPLHPSAPPPFSLPALRQLSRRIQARMQTAAPAAAPRHRVIMEGGLSKTKGRSGPLTLYTRFRRAFFFSSRGHGQASSRSTTRCVWEDCF